MLTDLSNYEQANMTLWQGRQDSLAGERYFQQVTSHNLQQSPLPVNTSQAIAILGFNSDEGIRRNEGRVGAKEGANALREQLAKLPCHHQRQFIDLGNIICDDGALEVAQADFAKVIHYCHQHGYKTIAFGGGHEIAWGHFCGLKENYKKLGIINFDAHFDLRRLPKTNHGTSGTPFWQIANHCQQNNRAFHYCCLGIQPHANTESLFTAADTFKVPYVTAEQINDWAFNRQTTFLDEFLINHDSIYLSICLDVFAECYAPGVSAPQALGLSPWQALPLLKYIIQTGKVVSIDIAELSPILDHHHKTARLAAMIIAELLQTN